MEPSSVFPSLEDENRLGVTFEVPQRLDVNFAAVQRLDVNFVGEPGCSGIGSCAIGSTFIVQ